MAEQKKKEEVYTTPKGVAKYPHLTVPQTLIGDKTVEPTFNVSLLLDPNDAATIALIEKIETAHKKGLAEAKAKNPKKKYIDQGTDNMFKDETTKDGEPTGKVVFKFKAKAQGKRKDGSEWSFRPALFDAKGAALPKDAAIFGGSVIKVGYSIRHAAMETGSFYTSLSLKAVQGIVIKSEYVKDASEFGFVSEDGEDAFGEQTASAGDSGAEQNADF